MKLTKLITDLAYKYGVHDIFSDFVEMAAISISNAVDKQQFGVREERYMRIVKRYTKDEARQFSMMLGALVDEMENTGGQAVKIEADRWPCQNLTRLKCQNQRQRISFYRLQNSCQSS